MGVRSRVNIVDVMVLSNCAVGFSTGVDWCLHCDGLCFFSEGQCTDSWCNVDSASPVLFTSVLVRHIHGPIQPHRTSVQYNAYVAFVHCAPCIRRHLVCLHPGWFVIFTAPFNNTSELWG